jgi:hypothetical protein
MDNESQKSPVILPPPSPPREPVPDFEKGARTPKTPPDPSHEPPDRPAPDEEEEVDTGTPESLPDKL